MNIYATFFFTLVPCKIIALYTLKKAQNTRTTYFFSKFPRVTIKHWNVSPTHITKDTDT